MTVVPVVTQPPRPTPDPRPHQWVYAKELRVMDDGGGKPWIHEQWIRVEGRKFINSASNRRVARGSKVPRERMDWIEGMPEGVLPADVRAALYQALARIPGSRSCMASPTRPAAAGWPSPGQPPSKGAGPVADCGWRSSWTATATATWAPDMS